MRLGEVVLFTNNVKRMADFYKNLLGVNNDSDDAVHQVIIADETMLTIYNDGTKKNNLNQNISIVFTVDDVDSEYKRLISHGVDIIEAPKTRPWGARNMNFYDPDKNTVYLRSFLK